LGLYEKGFSSNIIKGKVREEVSNEQQGERKMKKQLIGIVVTVLIFVGILCADSTIIASPVTMIIFGVYLLGIVGYSRRKQENKEYPLNKPGLHHPL
jgi:uncharacterized membrane protein YiaA